MKVALAYIPNSRSEILVAKRPESKSFGGMWEFPGGKLENGESPEDCIVREIHEELAIVVSVVSCVEPYRFLTMELGHIEFYPCFCEWVSGDIQKIEHADLRFLKIDAIKALNLAPPDIRALEILECRWGS